MTRALYPGTFDPIHNGHVDIATRAASLFDELVIGVYDSPPKTLTFDTAQRVALAQEALSHLPNVRVIPYRGLTVTYAQEIGALALVRGLLANGSAHRLHLFILEEDLPLFDFAKGRAEFVIVPERYRPASLATLIARA